MRLEMQAAAALDKAFLPPKRLWWFKVDMRDLNLNDKHCGPSTQIGRLPFARRKVEGLAPKDSLQACLPGRELMADWAVTVRTEVRLA